MAPANRALRVIGLDGVATLTDVWEYHAPVRLSRTGATFRTRLMRLLERKASPFFPGLLLGHAARPEPGATVPKTAGGHRMDFARGIAQLARQIEEGAPARLGPALALHVTEVTLALQSPDAPWPRSNHDHIGDEPRVSVSLGQYPAAARPRPMRAAWVETLSVGLLAFTMLYAVFGVPGESNVDTSQTDRVSPVNSYVWLAILMLSLPVFAQRWREVKALLLGCWPLLLLFAYFGASTIWALDPSASSRRFLFTLVQLLLFAVLLSGIRRAPSVHVVIAFVCAIAAFADLIGWVVAPGITTTSEGFAGLQGQKNQAGLLMMLGYLSAMPCLLLIRSLRARAFLGAGIVLMLGLLVATRSTTSESVVMYATVAMPVLVVVSRLPRAVVLAVFTALVCLIGTAALFYVFYCGAIGRDPMLPLRGATFTARTDIWNFVIAEIHKRPFFGAGYASFWSINPAVQPSLKSDQWFGVDAIINEAHDGYLDLLATNGIVGLAGGLIVLVRTIAQAAIALGRAAPARAAWQSGELAKLTALFYLVLTTGLVIHNFTESNLFSNNALLSVALLIAILDLEKWRIRRRAAGRE